jgi:hypothetical protein
MWYNYEEEGGLTFFVLLKCHAWQNNDDIDLFTMGRVQYMMSMVKNVSKNMQTVKNIHRTSIVYILKFANHEGVVLFIRRTIHI